MWLRAGKQDEGEEGAETPIHNSWAHVNHCHLDTVLSWSISFYEKSVSNVGTVINTKPDGNYEVDAGDSVNGQAPEVHEPCNVNEGENNHEEDKKRTNQMSH